MKLVDTNVLLYAVNDSSAQHDPSRAWLEAALSGVEPVGFAWLALVGFVRLSTKAAAMPVPLGLGTALDLVDDWLSAEAAVVLQPTARHASILGGLLTGLGTGGNLVNDAHLAALAVEHRAEIVTYDTDFARFADVRWSRPDEA